MRISGRYGVKIAGQKASSSTPSSFLAGVLHERQPPHGLIYDQVIGDLGELFSTSLSALEEGRAAARKSGIICEGLANEARLVAVDMGLQS